MNTTFIVGDIGGHPRVLEQVLRAVGVDSTFRLPEGVRVIQVGDLVRADPLFRRRNTAVIEIACAVMAANPASWIQLLGNHESAALGGPSSPRWDAVSAYESKCGDVLHHLWTQGRVMLATTVRTSSGDSLVTHAGLTQPRWLAMGSPSASAAAEIINSSVSRPLTEFVRPGSLVTKRADVYADTMWAEVNIELLEPWVTSEVVPFSQIHGHASPFHWAAGSWWPDTPMLVRKHTEVLTDLRRTVTRVPHSALTLTSVDWNLENDAPSRIWPLLSVASEESPSHD